MAAEFLGSGLIGPLVEGSTGEFVHAEGLALVKASIIAILGTQCRVKNARYFVAGERFMRDEFGCNTGPLKHESLDDELVALAESNYMEALGLWERRAVVTAMSTSLDQDAQAMATRIDFRLRQANAKGNVVVIRDAQGQLSFPDQLA